MSDDHKLKQLNPHDRDEDEEFTGTIIIPESKIKITSTLGEELVKIKHVSQKDHKDKLEAEYLENLTKKMLH